MSDPLTFDVTRKINTRLLSISLPFVGIHVSLLLFALLTYSKVEEIVTLNLEASTRLDFRRSLVSGLPSPRRTAGRLSSKACL